jgi:hypothetical protein
MDRMIPVRNYISEKLDINAQIVSYLESMEAVFQFLRYEMHVKNVPPSEVGRIKFIIYDTLDRKMDFLNKRNIKKVFAALQTPLAEGLRYEIDEELDTIQTSLMEEEGVARPMTPEDHEKINKSSNVIDADREAKRAKEAENFEKVRRAEAEAKEKAEEEKEFRTTFQKADNLSGLGPEIPDYKGFKKFIYNMANMFRGPLDKMAEVDFIKWTKAAKKVGIVTAVVILAGVATKFALNFAQDLKFRKIVDEDINPILKLIVDKMVKGGFSTENQLKSQFDQLKSRVLSKHNLASLEDYQDSDVEGDVGYGRY